VAQNEKQGGKSEEQAFHAGEQQIKLLASAGIVKPWMSWGRECGLGSGREEVSSGGWGRR
jgi:hypothetical protein